MQKAILILAAATAVAAPAMASPRLTPAEQLSKALEGRVAGTPVSCINPHMYNHTRVIDRTAIIYGSGRTIYLQQPDNASRLRNDDMLVTDLTGNGQLCNVDIVRLHDQVGGWFRGIVGLNKFVPYTRVQTASRD